MSDLITYDQLTDEQKAIVETSKHYGTPFPQGLSRDAFIAWCKVQSADHLYRYADHRLHGLHENSLDRIEGLYGRAQDELDRMLTYGDPIPAKELSDIAFLAALSAPGPCPDWKTQLVTEIATIIADDPVELTMDDGSIGQGRVTFDEARELAEKIVRQTQVR